MNILLWVVIAVSIALVCFAVAKQTGFKIPSLPDNMWVRRGITVSVVLGVVALVFPNVVGTITTDTISWAKDFDENYGRAPSATQATTEVPSSSGISTVPLVVPVGITVEVNRPNGHYLASVNCPKEVVMEVTDVSTGQLVKQQDCAETIRGGNLPLNIKLSFFQKGDNGGPVDVLVRWKKIS